MQVAQTPPQLRIVLSLFSAREESSHARVHVSSFTAGGELNNVLRSCNEHLFYDKKNLSNRNQCSSHNNDSRQATPGVSWST